MLLINNWILRRVQILIMVRILEFLYPNFFPFNSFTLFIITFTFIRETIISSFYIIRIFGNSYFNLLSSIFYSISFRPTLAPDNFILISEYSYFYLFYLFFYLRLLFYISYIKISLKFQFPHPYSPDLDFLYRFLPELSSLYSLKS